MKKVIIFGATGTVGRHIIQQSLDQGNLTVAFCRNKEKIQDLAHDHLTILEGDVLVQKDVDQAVIGMDAVIVTLGSGKNRRSTIRSVGTRNIIKAMKSKGVNRLICQTTLGTGESEVHLNFFWRHVMFGWFLKDVFQDHILQEKYVQESGLDWTIVKPAAFTNGALTGDYKFGFPTSTKGLTLKVSRADVADFVLKQVNSLDFLHKNPGLSY